MSAAESEVLAAASWRSARLPESRVSIAARSRNAGRRGQHTAGLARPAERSSSSATSSSGPGAASARCQARRSGSRLRIGDLRQRAVHVLPVLNGRRAVGDRTHQTGDETAPWPRTRASRPTAAGVAAAAFRSRAARRPATPAADHRAPRPPPPPTAAGSRWEEIPAAVGSSPRPSARAELCRRRTRPPVPPASSRAAAPNIANGLPRVSATIRSRTRTSSGPGSTESSSDRASLLAQTLQDQFRQSPPSRRSAYAPRTPHRPIPRPGGGPRRPGPALRRDRSTAHRPPDRSTGAARPHRRAGPKPPGPPGIDPARYRQRCPTAVRSASRWGPGSRSRVIEHRRAQLDAPRRNASSISDWTPAARATRQPDARSAT